MKTDAHDTEGKRIIQLLYDKKKLNEADFNTAAGFTGEADPKLCTEYGIAPHSTWGDLITVVRDQQAGRSAGV